MCYLYTASLGYVTIIRGKVVVTLRMLCYRNINMRKRYIVCYGRLNLFASVVGRGRGAVWCVLKC